MKILFVDESYYLNSKEPLFVLGGVVIPEKSWLQCKDFLTKIKKDNKINGEIKWKYVFNIKDPKGTMSHLSLESRLDKVIKPILEFVRDNNLQIFTTLTHISDLKQKFVESSKIEELSPLFRQEFERYYYSKNYENIVQRFQYYLQDLEFDNRGIVICDSRNSREDEYLRDIHKNMLDGVTGKKTIIYKNLIEHVLIAPSHLSIGIQFADVIAGIIYNRLRKNEKTNYLCQIISGNFNKQRGEKTSEGRGVVKIPADSNFWEKDK
jgi:hypothetical protein